MSIDYLGWVTNGRSGALEESLTSFLSHTPQGVQGLLICNDVPGAEEDILSVLKKIKSSFPGPIYYAGNKEKDRLINILSGGDLLRFALHNTIPGASGCGANRNTLLLASAGSRVVWADDDILCRYAPVPGDGSVEFSTAFDPFDIEYFASPEELLETRNFNEVNLLSRHDQVLGASLEFLAGERVPFYADEKLASLVREPENRVRVTMPGIGGDSGMGSPKMKLRACGEAREKFTASRERFRAMVCSRQLFRAPSCLTVNKSHFLMSYNLGLDARELLPLFSPAGRGAESLFAFFYSRCFPRDFTAYLPLAVYHHPLKERFYRFEELFDHSVKLTGLILLLLGGESFQPYAAPGENLKVLGKKLRFMGSQAEDVLAEEIDYVRREQLAAVSLGLEELLLFYDRVPDFWAGAVEQSLESIRKIIHSRMLGPVEFRDLPGALGPYLIRLGETLEQWPDFFNRARDMGPGEWMKTL